MIYDSRHPSLGGRSVGGHDCGDYQTTGEKAINFSLPDWVVAVGLASLYNDILWLSVAQKLLQDKLCSTELCAVISVCSITQTRTDFTDQKQPAFTQFSSGELRGERREELGWNFSQNFSNAFCRSVPTVCRHRQ